MDYWTHYPSWRERHRELLREAQERRLAREAREARQALARSKRPDMVEVRWGLPDDDGEIAELLELNGVPRWVAFEERFVVAERDGKVLAAVRYRTEPKRLLLGLLVVDPWAEERRLAVDLYAGARRLAPELGAREILAKADPHLAAYPHEAGYHRWADGWRMDLTRPVEPREELPAGGWRMRLALLGALVAAFLPRRQERQEIARGEGDVEQRRDRWRS